MTTTAKGGESRGDWSICETCGTGSPGGNAHAGDCASLPTQKQGPPTLRKALEDILKETRGVIHAPVHTLKNTMYLAEIACEALERDEKRRAALEEVADIVADLGLGHTTDCSGLSNPDALCSCGIHELSDALDALTPTQDKD